MSFWPNGKRLRVRFLWDTAYIKEKIRQYTQVWEKYANIDFRFVETGPAEIRIAFKDDGSGSYVGTENTRIPAEEPTMNFGSFDRNTREEEFSRTTIHEFGHALGCIHEHQSPAAEIKWDEGRLLEYFKPWSKETIEHNIISKYAQGAVVNTAFDMRPIMLYFFPASITTNNLSTPLNSVLSDQDKTFINSIYPFQNRAKGSFYSFSTLENRPWYPPMFLNPSRSNMTQPTYKPRR
ncbi:hypothetical protein BDV38DRAFT_286625 [Aspergillus pseudotamarii]|uniref:Peptidase metallopeptidase domain-containing protein n=1 Tax=Aspergillus pseudotamarii TaxID=132259 RepID=A0A5N6SFT8_ASPPS|nr:uncharacterized protein BDV38DRAFT_286625 [Aspergillus pseudotamarii]KAE8133586.1 hypothetical protein BDV38DRAFT_286625 [Aspergillus pseudotamarii]